MENLERLTKIFEKNVPERTVPFDARPKISIFFLPKWIAPTRVNSNVLPLRNWRLLAFLTFVLGIWFNANEKKL